MAAAPTAGARLVEQLLPAVRFATCRQPDAAMDIGVSKFGGAPDLPQGTRWPMGTAGDGQEQPLQFCAQVNLAAAREVAAAPLNLPAEGQLSFFADLVGGRDAAVLYSPPESYFVRCSPRISPLPSGELHPVGTWTWPAVPLEGGGIPSSEQQSLAALEQAMEAELKTGIPERWLLTGRHQLGGHVRRPVPGHEAGRRLLLQLDSDESLEVSWEGGATLFWLARPEDIEAGRWDAAVFQRLSP